MADKDDPNKKPPSGIVQQRRSRDFLIVKRGESARPGASPPTAPVTPAVPPPPAAPPSGPWRSAGHAAPPQRQPAAYPPAVPPAAPPPGLPPGTPGAPAAPPLPTGPRDRLLYDGSLGELYVIFIINLLLSIVTLGIYRFWGKTRIRRYVWSHTSLHGERFEYAGTGLELFLGFLMALAIYAPFLAALYYVQIEYPPIPDARTGAPDWDNLILLIGLNVAFFIVFLYLYSVAVFSTFRYRVSRTLWRGLRGSVSGSAYGYGARAFGSSILNSICLGLLRPLIDAWLMRYRLSNTTIGNRNFKLDLDGGGLYTTFIVTWLLTIPTLGLAQFWYQAALLRAVAGGTQFENLRFESDVRGGSLLGFTIVNILIYVFTLTLGYPIVVQRTLKYLGNHLVVVGEQNFDEIAQSSQWRPRTGEGLGEFMGVGWI
ncbi:MAG: YjgN family protein [Alphaproteobacteria bacterium]